MFRAKHLIEVNYKSGIQKRFWVYKFTASGGLSEVTWEPVDENRPMIMNIDEVESIWKVREARLWTGRA
jgi:hypothetical protein